MDACCIHWGPEQESTLRHPSLLQQYSRHHDWVLIRAFKREQGLLFDSTSLTDTPEIPETFDPKFRWSVRQPGSGGQRYLMEVLSKHGMNYDMLNITDTSLSEREAAASIALQKADIVL